MKKLIIIFFINFIVLFGDENTNSYIPNNNFRISKKVTITKTRRKLGFNEALVNIHNILKIFIDNKEFILILVGIIKGDKLIVLIKKLKGKN